MIVAGGVAAVVAVIWLLGATLCGSGGVWLCCSRARRVRRCLPGCNTIQYKNTLKGNVEELQLSFLPPPPSEISSFPPQF